MNTKSHFQSLLNQYLTSPSKKSYNQISKYIDNKVRGFYNNVKTSMLEQLGKDHEKGKVSSENKSELEKRIENYEYPLKMSITYSLIGNVEFLVPFFMPLSHASRAAFHLAISGYVHYKNDERKKPTDFTVILLFWCLFWPLLVH